MTILTLPPRGSAMLSSWPSWSGVQCRRWSASSLKKQPIGIPLYIFYHFCLMLCRFHTPCSIAILALHTFEMPWDWCFTFKDVGIGFQPRYAAFWRMTWMWMLSLIHLSFLWVDVTCGNCMELLHATDFWVLEIRNAFSCQSCRQRWRSTFFWRLQSWGLT